VRGSRLPATATAEPAALRLPDAVGLFLRAAGDRAGFRSGAERAALPGRSSGPWPMASRGYLIAFVAPCGLMDEYVTDSLILPGDSQGQSIAGLGPLLVGEVPIVRLDSGVIGKAVRHQRGFAGL